MWISNFMKFVAVTALVLLTASANAQPPTLTRLMVDGEDGLTIVQGADGSTWAEAYLYLQDAIAEANGLADPDNHFEIWVKGNDSSGVPYYPDEGANVDDGEEDETFELHSFVAIYCGFAGTEDIDDDGFLERDAVKFKVILSGDIDQDGNGSNNSWHVLRANAPVGTTAILDGATITGGYADNGEVQLGQNGGGMVIIGGSQFGQQYQSQPTILRCRFTDTVAAGGAVFIRTNQESVPEFRNCIFDNNESDGAGGAFECDDLGGQGNQFELFLTNCLLYDNDANGAGGGVHCDNYTYAYLQNCTVSQNHSIAGGALAHNVDATATGEGRTGEIKVWNTIVWDNTRTGSSSNSLEANLSGAANVNHSCIGNLASPYPTGDGNTSDDPEFVDPGNNNFRLECGSAAINAGDDGFVQGDAFDLWQNGMGTLDDNPDLLLWRIAGTDGDGTDVDMGAYETLPAPCAADLALPSGVEVNDLLAVISAWGECQNCPADFWPGVCGGDGDGIVDQHEIDLVVMYWGTECGESLNGGDTSDLEIVRECILAALAQNLTGEEFVDFLMDCLCEHDVIDCD